MSVELTKPRNRRQEIWNCLRRHKERFQTTAEIAESCDLQAPAVYGRLNFRRQGSNQILLKFPAPSLTGILLKRPIIFLGIFIYCLSSFSG